MSTLRLPVGYDAFLQGLKERVRAAKLRASLSVNRELVLLYWGIGRDILARQSEQGWGAKIIDRFAQDLRREFPDMMGLSLRNLKYMRAFAEAWPEEPIVQQLVAQIRYYEEVIQKDGSITHEQKAKCIAPVCHDYRTKGAVMPLVAEILQDINSTNASPESTFSLERFVENSYLPYVSNQKRPSTYRGYRNMWKRYLKKPCGQTRLRDFRTVDGERLLAEIARQYDLSRNTLKRIKNLMSGIFKCAKRLGCINGVNPMQDVSVPKSRAGGETYAYSLEEILKMISILPEPAASVVATTAFTGMRKGEIRGLLWEKYGEGSIGIIQSVWESFISEPKTERSKSAVPVIKPLAMILRKHRERSGNPQKGFIFVSRRDGREGGPINMDSLLKWQIKPKLKEERIPWRGWHAFRRGLATNLYRLGVPDKTIQAILRHSNLSTTMNSYVKSVPQDAVGAMQAFEAACRKYAPRTGGRKLQSGPVQNEYAPPMHLKAS